MSHPPTHRRPGGWLGLWWAFGAVVLAGLFIAVAGQLLAGGTIIAAGFALAALWRHRAADPGGLIVRNRRLDVWFYAAFAVNVLGAVLLVDRRMEGWILAMADLALAFAGFVVLLRPTPEQTS